MLNFILAIQVEQSIEYTHTYIQSTVYNPHTSWLHSNISASIEISCFNSHPKSIQYTPILSHEQAKRYEKRSLTQFIKHLRTNCLFCCQVYGQRPAKCRAE